MGWGGNRLRRVAPEAVFLFFFLRVWYTIMEKMDMHWKSLKKERIQVHTRYDPWKTECRKIWRTEKADSMDRREN